MKQIIVTFLIVVGAILAGIIIATVAIGVFGALPIMLLWNWLMPMLFGLKVITFWQSFGLLILSSLLFKSPNISNFKNIFKKD